MSLPSIEPIPDENENLPPARRRRQRRRIVPPGSGEQAEFLIHLSERMVPSFDFFLFSLLAGLTLGLALLLDSPALVFLAALLAPFMAPALGISLGTITGVVRFVLMSLGSLSIGSLIVFLCGLVAGLGVYLLPAQPHVLAAFHSQFSWTYFTVLAIGAALTNYLIARSPSQRPLVTSVAIAYGLYVPVGVAGFGLSSGIAGLWPNGLGLFFLHLVWTAIIGTLMLRLLNIRPLKAIGYGMSAVYALIGLVLLGMQFAQAQTAPLAPGLTQTPGIAGIALAQPTNTPSPSTTVQPEGALTATVTPIQRTPTATRTRTLVPSKTVTQTVTPAPTPVWARINAEEGNGAIIRVDPSYDAKVIQALLNGTLVEVLPDQVVEVKNTTWVKVRTVDGKEGWIVRFLLRTATPAPGW
jgi:hypothetical protein